MEEQALKAKDYIMFKAFIGGDMESPLANLSTGEATAYQMINIMIALKTSLEELIIKYPDLYAEALKTPTSTHSVQIEKEDEQK